MPVANKNRSTPDLHVVGDSALLVEFEELIDPTVNARVLALKQSLENSALHTVKTGIIEIVAAYRSLLIYYDIRVIQLDALKEAVARASERGSAAPARGEPKNSATQSSKRWRVPVHYGGEAGIDLDEVARIHQLSAGEIIKLHSGASYRVYMLGFAPGWCYLGGLPAQLHTPRLSTPRAQVPAGCISIGGQQAMLGALAMPSGWRLLGQTPLQNYNSAREPNFLIHAGDELQFYPVDAAEFDRLSKAVQRGEMIATAETL